eukprot:1322502-Amorphochlora_amoeboformis.AAC.1
MLRSDLIYLCVCVCVRQENGWGGIGGVNVGRGITSSMTAKHRSEGEFRFDLSALKELALGAACHQKPQPLRSRL